MGETHGTPRTDSDVTVFLLGKEAANFSVDTTVNFHYSDTCRGLLWGVEYGR